MKKILAVLIGGLILLGGSNVFGEVDYSPGKFKNNATIGKKRQLRQIYTRDLIQKGMLRKGIVHVTKWTDFTRAGTGASGQSVYQIDLTLGNIFLFDITAIAADVAVDVALNAASAVTGGPNSSDVSGATAFESTMLQVSGVSVMAPETNDLTDGAIFTVGIRGAIGATGVTPIMLHGPSYTGITIYQNIEKLTPVSGTSNWTTVSSVSDYGIFDPSDTRTYRIDNDDGSGASIFVVDTHLLNPWNN